MIDQEDLDFTYVDEGHGQTWIVDTSGADFLGIFTLVRTEEFEQSAGARQGVTAELRWRANDLAALEPNTLLRRVLNGTYWTVDGRPEDDGFGEIIATITQNSKNRVGA